MNLAQRSLAAAALATTLALVWQFATVQSNYGGNWTGLYCVGSRSTPPGELNAGVWIFPASKGYDGQWYRIVARDPWMRHGLSRYLDTPQRIHRILLPAAAWVLAFGQPGWVDSTYIAAALLFLFAGVWMTARWSADQGESPWWGLAFAALPGTLITIDRMTVDIALYALIVAALYCWRRNWWLGCWAAGAGALLARELGLLLIGAFVLACLVKREWRRGAVLASSALPGALWVFYVGHRTALPRGAEVVPVWADEWTLIGPFQAILNPRNYALAGWFKPATQTLDGLAIAGVVLAVCIALVRLRRRPLDVEPLLYGLYVILFVLVSGKGFWVDPYSYSRAFTPLAGLIAWRGVVEKRAWLALPLGFMVARIVWQMGSQALGIFEALTS
jgi:hypothetical protein